MIIITTEFPLCSPYFMLGKSVFQVKTDRRDDCDWGLSVSPMRLEVGGSPCILINHTSFFFWRFSPLPNTQPLFQILIDVHVDRRTSGYRGWLFPFFIAVHGHLRYDFCVLFVSCAPFSFLRPLIRPCSGEHWIVFVNPRYWSHKLHSYKCRPLDGSDGTINEWTTPNPSWQH